MIKSLFHSGKYLTVSGGQPATTYINPYSGAQGAGMMRYNGSNYNIEVYDGTMWQTLQSSHASVQLDSEAISILDWAKEKQRQEMELESLSLNHPAVKAAYENVKRAKEHLQTTIILSKDAQTTN
jgi:hypothetical protein